LSGIRWGMIDVPAPYLDPRHIYGPEARYITDWIKDQIGYDTLIDPALRELSVDINHDDQTISVRPTNLTWFHSRVGRAAMSVVGKMRGELWFPEFATEPHLKLIEGGAS
jgi:hypothetical protein